MYNKIKTNLETKKKNKQKRLFTCTRNVIHPKLDQRATPKLWNEVTLSSAIRKFIEMGLRLVPPLGPPGCPGFDTHIHIHAHRQTYTEIH